MKKNLKFLITTALFFILTLNSINLVQAAGVGCGTESDNMDHECNCPSGESQLEFGTNPRFCCGYVQAGECCAAISGSGICLDEPAGVGGDDDDDGGLSPVDDPVTAEDLDSFNPLLIEGSAQADKLSTPTGIIGRVLEFAFPIAGLILFVMIVWGGFEMLSGAAGKKGLDAGKQRVTAAVIGFLLLFASYWIVQIIEKIFGVDILG